MLEYILTGFVFGMYGFVFNRILINPDGILSWWPLLVRRVIPWKWLHKPLYSCMHCHAGWVAILISILIIELSFWGCFSVVVATLFSTYYMELKI